MYIHTLQCYIFSEHYLHAPAVWIPPSARNTVYRSIIVASGFGMFNRSFHWVPWPKEHPVPQKGDLYREKHGLFGRFNGRIWDFDRIFMVIIRDLPEQIWDILGWSLGITLW